MKRLKRMVFAGMLISIISTTVVLLYTSTEHTLPALLAVKPIYLLAAVLLHILSYCIWGYRMSVLCKSLNEHVGTSKCTEIATSSLLMAAITPSSAGGEPVRVYMLAKEGMPAGKASAIVVAER
ncbi:MAG: flippase-like domain-containing protein, partial [Methanosarcinales archaeon]|nr:flippase-like domain-containing protein [Methanosarcinales archaeon]